MITIIGGTGMLGGHLCRELRAGGFPVRVMTRNPERARALEQSGVELTRGDLRDPSSLHAALSGARVVISASHALLGGRANSSAQVDDAGQRTLIDAAKRAGVEHFVFVSALGAAPDHAVDFWRTKWRIEQYLKASGLPHTIVRPSAFMDMHAYELLGKPVLQDKRVAISGAGTNARNFVAAEDVARLIALHVQPGATPCEIIEIGGPQNLSSLQVVRVFETFGKKSAKALHLPLSVLRTLSAVITSFHPGVGRVMRAAAVFETTDQAFDAAPLTSGFSFPLMTLEQWVQKNCSPPRGLENRPLPPGAEA